MSDNKEVKFKGSIVRSVYNSDNFKIYAVNVDREKYPDIKLTKYRNASICGDLPDLAEGVEYEIAGIEENGKYGYSYRVKDIKRDVPSTAEGVYFFLREILTENQANVLFKAYPNIIDLIKEDRSHEVDVSKLHGIGEITFNKIKSKIIDNFCLMDIVAEFKGMLSLTMLKKIYERYPSIEMLRHKLKKEPYTTLTRVSGIGFKTADTIIVDMQNEGIIDFGFDIKTSIDRCLACIMFILQENENDGNTTMNLADLRTECYNIVPACADHFVEAMQHVDLYYNKETMNAALRRTYNTEEYISKTILENLNNDNNVWECDIEKYRNVGEFSLSDEQIKAVENVCKYPISILNGPGGTGKSFSTQAIINMLEDNMLTFNLFSPTGKAAKILAEYTGRTASTIHRGLGFSPGEGKCTYDESNKLCCDIVIIDEFSMVDIFLFKKLLEAIDFNKTKLLMIGDNAQLPSVGCGNLLNDFMESNIIPTATLTNVFRYSEGGLMRVATDTRCCKQYLDKSMKDKATFFGDNKDYVFIDSDSDKLQMQVVALYKKLLADGNSVENIQVLTAKNVGEQGTVALNNAIQKVANHHCGDVVFMKVGETFYYKGDLIIQTSNNYSALIEIDYLPEDLREYYKSEDKNPPDAFVANGEVGVIEEINNNYAIINFDGVYVRYYRDNMQKVNLGYAITIHKSQGSSIDNVILCTPQSHMFMLNSNLIYVGLTRMRKKCYHIGSLNSVNMAVYRKANLSRKTFMQEMLECYSQNLHNS